MERAGQDRHRHGRALLGVALADARLQGELARYGAGSEQALRVEDSGSLRNAPFDGRVLDLVAEPVLRGDLQARRRAYLHLGPPGLDDHALQRPGPYDHRGRHRLGYPTGGRLDADGIGEGSHASSRDHHAFAVDLPSLGDAPHEGRVVDCVSELVEGADFEGEGLGRCQSHLRGVQPDFGEQPLIDDHGLRRGDRGRTWSGAVEYAQRDGVHAGLGVGVEGLRDIAGRAVAKVPDEGVSVVGEVSESHVQRRWAGGGTYAEVELGPRLVGHRRLLRLCASHQRCENNNGEAEQRARPCPRVHSPGGLFLGGVLQITVLGPVARRCAVTSTEAADDMCSIPVRGEPSNEPFSYSYWPFRTSGQGCLPILTPSLGA